MKIFLLVLLLGGGASNAAMLKLQNLGSFAARLEAINDTQVRVKLPWSPDEVSIPLASLEEWTGKASAPSVEAPDVFLRFNNGDELSAKLLGIEKDGFRVKTTWGQTVGIRRGMVGYIETIPDKSRVILDLPGPVEAWRNNLGGDPSIRVREVGGGIQPSQGHPVILSRDFPPTPERFRMDLRVRLLEGTPVFMLLFMSNVPNRFGAGNLSLQFNAGNVAVNPMGAMARNPNTTPIPIPSAKEGVMEIRIYGDWVERSSQIWLNGVRIWSGKIPPGDANQPSHFSSLQMRTQTEMSFVIEGFRIHQWGGQPIQEDVFKAKAKTHVLLFQNGDSLVGDVLSYSEDFFTIRSETAEELRVPLRAVDRITLPAQGARRPRRQARDIQVTAGNSRDRLTVDLLSLEAGVLSGKSEHFDAPLLIPLNSITQILFNIHRAANSQMAAISGERP